jgi:hypothetical protein
VAGDLAHHGPGLLARRDAAGDLLPVGRAQPRDGVGARHGQAPGGDGVLDFRRGEFHNADVSADMSAGQAEAPADLVAHLPLRGVGEAPLSRPHRQLFQAERAARQVQRGQLPPQQVILDHAPLDGLLTLRGEV